MSENQIITFGCRLNNYESEVIKDALSKAGTENAIVFNTCAVTKEAERQARQSIRKARREHPDKKIIVTGCAAQLSPDSFAMMPEVDKVIGNEEKVKASSYLETSLEKVLVNDIMSIKETASHLVSSFDGKSRAFVQIQNGCNHRCTFCIIPFARGNSRSLAIGQIVTQVRQLVEAGYNEVVLTGVDISDYGLDLPGQPSLAQMLRRLLALVPELARLRLSSIDVAEITPELFDLLVHETRIMPHVHISLQAGDNMILKRMKRRHNREQVIEFCHQLRAKRPGVAFGADIIAGFPTESDEMFANSLKLISEAGLQYLHVFPYSSRPGTPAARMPQVPQNIRKERANLLRQEGEKELVSFLQTQLGTTLSVIVEQGLIARGDNFATVKLDQELPPGTILAVSINGVEGNMLLGSYKKL